MDFDFPAFLVTLTAVTGIIWALDALLWAKKRRAAGSDQEPILVEYSRSFFPVILVVLVLRSFIVEPFRIPSGSMMPTLLVGDFILVNKFSYGLRLPVLNTKVVDVGEPQRGDVFVFRYPRDPSIDYIKRVVGLPGDRVEYRNRVLYVNGERYDKTRLGTYTGVGSGAVANGSALLLEKGPVEHQILNTPSKFSTEGSYIVPEGHYFAMGDNRDGSSDSRFWGVVPAENLVGKAFMIWMNWDSAIGSVAWERIGRSIE